MKYKMNEEEEKEMMTMKQIMEWRYILEYIEERNNLNRVKKENRKLWKLLS